VTDGDLVKTVASMIRDWRDDGRWFRSEKELVVECDDLAARILSHLKAENARLREALSDIATEVREHGDDGLLGVVYRMQDCARAALGDAP